MSAEPRSARSFARSGFQSGTGTSTTIPMCTGKQRHHVAWYLRQRGLPVTYLTDEHRALFERAGIAWAYGARIDTTLRGVSSPAAQRLINALREYDDGTA